MRTSVLKFLLLVALAIPGAAYAQAPDVPTTGSLGSGGSFPLITSPAVVFTSDANHTMVYPEMAGSGGVLKVTSSVALTATRTLVAPQTKGFSWMVVNATTGGQSITVAGPSGTGVTVANGATVTLLSDGTNYLTGATAAGQPAGTGIVKVTGGVAGLATAGTDYATPAALTAETTRATTAEGVNAASVTALAQVARTGAYADLTGKPAAGMSGANNLSELTNRATARNNLGLSVTSTEAIGAGSSAYYTVTEAGGATVDTVQGYMPFWLPLPSSGLRLVFGNSWGPNETPGPGMTISASIEMPNDTTPQPLFFNGARVGSLSPGGIITTDPIARDTSLTTQLVYVRWIARRNAGDNTAFPANWGFTKFSGATLLAPYTTTRGVARFDGLEELKTRTVADGVTNGTTTLTSATAAFVSASESGQWIDLSVGGTFGSCVNGAGVGTGTHLCTTIATVTNATTVVLAAAPSGSATGVSISVVPADKTLSGTINNSTGGYGFAPWLMVARVAGVSKQAALCCDSITYGQGDLATNSGWGQRSLNLAGVSAGNGVAVANAIPYVNLSMFGETMYNLITNHSLRFSQIYRSKYLLALAGTNDIGLGRTITQTETDFLTLNNQIALRGTLPFFGTLTPRETSSTDGFTSVGGQTTASTESIRLAFNNWLRDGAPMSSTTNLPVAVGSSSATTNRTVYYGVNGTPQVNATSGVATASGPGTHPCAGIFELADTVETARDSGKWAIPVGNRVITDVNTTAGSTTITSATANFTSADTPSVTYPNGKQILIVGAGAAGANFAGYISTVVNATTATVSFSAPSTAVTGGTATIANSSGYYALTVDGLHPSPPGHQLMSVSGGALVATWSF